MPTINLQPKNIPGLVAAFERAPHATIRELRLFVKKGIRDIQQTARGDHRFISRSGNTERAIDTIITSEQPPAGKVFLNSAISSYAHWVHGGTQPHDIYPRNRNWLRWPAQNGSSFMFAKKVHHPGTKADEFIYKAGETNRLLLNALFDEHAQKAMRGAGL